MAKNGCSVSKISIWWDVENCHVPRNVDPHYIAQNLRSALHHANLNGPITIDLFGDTRNLDQKTLEALSSTGITINHIPSGNKDAADKAILVAMLFWALDNSPPAHFLLISGDGDFANALHRLRLKGYDILLARPDQPVKPALLGAATSVWYWTSVAKGDIAVAEGAKQPYEGPSGRFPSNRVGNDDLIKVDPNKQKSLPKIVSQHNTLLAGGSGVPMDEGIQSLNQRSAPLQESDQSGKINSSKVPEPYHVKSETYNCSSDEKRFMELQSGISPGITGSKEPRTCHVKCDMNNFSVDEERFVGLQRDISPVAPAHPWMSVCGTKTSISHEDMRRFDEVSAKLDPKLQADGKSHTPIASSAKQVGFPSSKEPWNLGHQPVWSGAEKTDLSKQSCDKHGLHLASSNKIFDCTKETRATFVPTPAVTECLPCLPQDAQRAYNLNVYKLMKTFVRLQLEGLMPTQEYLQDCLCYWDKQYRKINLKQVIDQAVQYQHIAAVEEGALIYFLPCNAQLWKCFNIGDMEYAFSDELWKEFYQFLSCSKNWQFFVHSLSMYEAAQRLKVNGHNRIRDLAVGEIILFLNQAIRKRNWLNVEITPTFVLSIKSLFVMEQKPSEGIMNSTSRIPRDDKGMPNVTCTNSGAEVSSLHNTSTKLLIFGKLRTWLLETSQRIPDYDVSMVPKDFAKATGIHLDIKKLGFSKLQELIGEFDDVVTIKLVRKGLKVLCPAINKVNRFKLRPPFLEASQVKHSTAKLTCQNTAAKVSTVTTKSGSSFLENQGDSLLSAASASQRSGVSQISIPKTSVPDGVSLASNPYPSACVVNSSKDVASVKLTSRDASVQNFPEKAPQNHPSLKKLRGWLLQLPSLQHGYDPSLIKRDFHQATGIVLDPPSLGYPKMKDILNEFRKDFRMESPKNGQYLLFRNNEGIPAIKSKAGSNTQHLAGQNSGHVVGEDVTSKPAQKSAGNKTSSTQWKERCPTPGVSDGGSEVGVTTNIVVATGGN